MRIGMASQCLSRRRANHSRRVASALRINQIEITTTKAYQNSPARLKSAAKETSRRPAPIASNSVPKRPPLEPLSAINARRKFMFLLNERFLVVYSFIKRCAPTEPQLPIQLHGTVVLSSHLEVRPPQSRLKEPGEARRTSARPSPCPRNSGSTPTF